MHTPDSLKISKGCMNGNIFVYKPHLPIKEKC